MIAPTQLLDSCWDDKKKALNHEQVAVVAVTLSAAVKPKEQPALATILRHLARHILYPGQP